MPTYDAVTDLPDWAVGDNGRPNLMLSPMETENFALPTLLGNGVKGLRVFKTGNLKDSKGRARDWSREDLEQMVANFEHLRTSGILPNVPVRENHSRDVRLIGGYFSGLRVSVEPDETGAFFLEADIDFTEPEMQGRYERGTYRNRSIEIGSYETNTGEVYFPTVIGLAFCDIPAVEGLYSAALSTYSSDETPEIMVYAPNNPANAAASKAGAGSTPATANDPAESLDEVLRELTAILAAESDLDRQNAIQKVVQAVEALKAPAAAPAAPLAHVSGDAMPDTFKFTLDGTDMDLAGDENTRRVVETLAANFTRVHEENVAFRQAAQDAAMTARVAAVDTWLANKKIVPAQVEGMKEYVKTLSDEQFSAHKALTEGMPDLSFTAQVDGESAGNETSVHDAEVRKHRQVIEMLRFNGITGEKLAATSSAKALVALGASLEA